MEFLSMLEGYGFLVNPPVPSQMWNKHVDHWGRFDLEAIPLKHQELTFFIQIATRWKFGQQLKDIESFPKSLYRRVFMVRKKNYEPFEIKEYLMGAWIEHNLFDFLNMYGTKLIETAKVASIEE